MLNKSIFLMVTLVIFFNVRAMEKKILSPLNIMLHDKKKYFSTEIDRIKNLPQENKDSLVLILKSDIDQWLDIVCHLQEPTKEAHINTKYVAFLGALGILVPPCCFLLFQNFPSNQKIGISMGMAGFSILSLFVASNKKIESKYFEKNSQILVEAEKSFQALRDNLSVVFPDVILD